MKENGGAVSCRVSRTRLEAQITSSKPAEETSGVRCNTPVGDGEAVTVRSCWALHGAVIMHPDARQGERTNTTPFASIDGHPRISSLMPIPHPRHATPAASSPAGPVRGGSHLAPHES